MTAEVLTSFGVKRIRGTASWELRDFTIEVEVTTPEMQELYRKAADVLDYVVGEYEAGARMIIDNILITAAKLATAQQQGSAFAILSEFRLGPQPFGPALLISGTTDYGIVRYTDKPYVKSTIFKHGVTRNIKALKEQGFPQWYIIVEAKRDKEHMDDWMPEAIAQAMLVQAVTEEDVHFCVATSSAWLFAKLHVDENGKFQTQEGFALEISHEVREGQTDKWKQSFLPVVRILVSWLSRNGKLVFVPI